MEDGGLSDKNGFSKKNQINHFLDFWKKDKFVALERKDQDSTKKLLLKMSKFVSFDKLWAQLEKLGLGRLGSAWLGLAWRGSQLPPSVYTENGKALKMAKGQLQSDSIYWSSYSFLGSKSQSYFYYLRVKYFELIRCNVNIY